MGKGQAITGLVLGIVAIVLSFFSAFPFVSFVALALAIIGLVLAVIGGKKLAANNQPKGIATGGLVVSIIAVVISAIFALTCGVCQAGLAAVDDEDLESALGELEDAVDELEDTYEEGDVVMDMSGLFE